MVEVSNLDLQSLENCLLHDVRRWLQRFNCPTYRQLLAGVVSHVWTFVQELIQSFRQFGLFDNGIADEWAGRVYSWVKATGGRVCALGSCGQRDENGRKLHGGQSVLWKGCNWVSRSGG